MNDIEELIKIIEELGGSATAEQITDYYCREHHMYGTSLHKSVVINTLNGHPDWVVSEDGKYCLANTETSPAEWSGDFRKAFVYEGVNTDPERYKIYMAGAWKLWQEFHDRYRLNVGSEGKAVKGNNRNITFRTDGGWIIQVVIGLKKTTLYIRDEEMRAATGLVFEESTDGYRTHFINVDECIKVLRGIL